MLLSGPYGNGNWSQGVTYVADGDEVGYVEREWVDDLDRYGGSADGINRAQFLVHADADILFTFTDPEDPAEPTPDEVRAEIDAALHLGPVLVDGYSLFLIRVDLEGNVTTEDT